MLTRRRLRRTGRLGVAAGALLVTGSLLVVPAPAAAAPAAPAPLACPASAIDACFDASGLTDLSGGGLTIAPAGTRPATTGPAPGAPVDGASPSLTLAGPLNAAPVQAAPAPPPPPGPPYISDGNCTFDGTAFPCFSTLLGYYNPQDNCFWSKMSPQPPQGDPLWGGQSNNNPAALYNVTCQVNSLSGIATTAVSVQYSPAPPLNYDQNTNVSQKYRNVLPTLVAAASVYINLFPVPTQTAPAGDPAASGLVGLPVWMWSPTGRGIVNQIAVWLPPLTIKLSVGILTVNISLFGTQVDWDMGDGNHVICATLGTAFGAPGTGDTSPSCGYLYKTAGQYPVMATMTWYVTFNIPLVGSGTVVIVRTSRPSTLTINELQVVTE